MVFVLFILGAAVGSFLNVVAERYEPEKFILNRKIIGGRSFCPFCRAELRWFELIPLASFLIQAGRCRRCRQKISFQYPLTEIISGLIFVAIPLKISANFYILHFTSYILVFLWLLVFSALFVASLIDFRLRLIPDEINIFLIFLGFFLITLNSPSFGLLGGSFLGGYAMLFGFRENIWLNHFLAAALAGAFFGFLILLTRGRGMGVGDLKLAVSLGWVFGWPDIILIFILSFLMGSLAGLGTIVFRSRHLKDYLAFAPFLSLGSLLVLLLGGRMAGWYFGAF